MTRRRNTVNIYDYPEHLNPFREDVDDNCDKFNTTGRRRPSFANAWTMFSPSKGKSQTSEDIPPQTQQTAASRFMTWTPKLLRRSFRRSSNSSSSSPWDNSSHSSSRLSFRTPSSRSSLPPPSSSRTSLQSPPSSSLHRTTPPSRPAPPSFRPPLSPSNSQNIPSIESNPVPPRRRALYTASSPGKTAGEKPPEDEVKYIQQGAKPKKKRRAPLPPQPSPNKTPGDSQQANSNEVEITVTAPASSNCTQELTTQTESTSERPDLEVKAKEGLPEKENQESHPSAEEQTQQSVDTGKIEDTPPEEQQHGEASESLEIKEESKVEEPPLPDEINKSTNKSSIVGLNTESSRLEIPKSEEQEKDVENHIIEKSQDITKGEKVVQDSTDHHLNGMNGCHNSDEHLKVNFDVVLHISEEDLRDKDHTNESENKNYSTGIENGNTENEKGELDNKEREDTHKLQNGGKALYNSEVLQHEMQLNDKNMNETSAKAPEPKPRTILQIKD